MEVDDGLVGPRGRPLLVGLEGRARPPRRAQPERAVAAPLTRGQGNQDQSVVISFLGRRAGTCQASARWGVVVGLVCVTATTTHAQCGPPADLQTWPASSRMAAAGMVMELSPSPASCV